MRECTVAVFTLVTVLLVTGLLMDIHFLGHFASTMIKDWTSDLNSINKMERETRHGTRGRQTRTNTKNRAIRQTGTKNRAVNQTDIRNRAIALTHIRNLEISRTDKRNRTISHTDRWDHGTKLTSLACPYNNSSPPLDDKTRKTYEIHDLLRVKTPAFLSNYKNPCWEQDNPSKLVCLPYFYLAGFPKCGTTFTFSTIVGHPEAVKGKVKEPHWIARKRFKERSDLQCYVDKFSPAARVIDSEVSIDPLTGQTFHPIITGDGSASTAWHNPNWRYLPGNYNCTEPRVLTPHYLYHLNPSTKVIILVRNPTERVISGYNYFIRGHITAESFHAKMVQDLRTFEDCCSKYSFRVCAYNDNIRLPIGLYHVFIRDWMNVFPADQILIVRLEDIRGDPFRAFTRIFNFLGLSHVSRSDLREILNSSRMNDKRKRFQATNETLRLLDDFYRPHNIQLARLLQQHDPNSYLSIQDAMYSH
ncbi:carbohydrate sulfotransferase 15-like [Haliotis asinina]|uniref:carbohydrate sulfotransferase 15-like n=1 Tax=Haliotis asinina TaxID=109174 RepID=UPI0035325EB6